MGHNSSRDLFCFVPITGNNRAEALGWKMDNLKLMDFSDADNALRKTRAHNSTAASHARYKWDINNRLCWCAPDGPWIEIRLSGWALFFGFKTLNKTSDEAFSVQNKNRSVATIGPHHHWLFIWAISMQTTKGKKIYLFCLLPCYINQAEWASSHSCWTQCSQWSIPGNMVPVTHSTLLSSLND